MPLTPEKKALAKENIGLVHACARRFLGRGIEYEDLVGAGSVGLVKAAMGFDPALGYKFSTYAVPSVLGEIKRLFRDGGSVKMSRGAKEKAAALLETADRLREELGREPTVSEIAEISGVSPADAAALLTAALPPVSLTTDENDEADLPVSSHEDAAITKMDLAAALEKLDEAERHLLHLRYQQNLTQAVVGERLGMTQVQVSRAEKKILGKLREMMG